MVFEGLFHRADDRKTASSRKEAKQARNTLYPASTTRRLIRSSLPDKTYRTSPEAVAAVDSLIQREIGAVIQASLEAADHKTLRPADLEGGLKRLTARRFLEQYKPIVERLREACDYANTQLNIMEAENERRH